MVIKADRTKTSVYVPPAVAYTSGGPSGITLTN
jgi:hypothetical protein